MASLNNVSNHSEVRRRSANFKPSIWHNDYIQSLNNAYYKNESCMKQSKVLKEEVRIMFSKVVNHVDQLELIDVFQRLGVAYHFKDEIRNILDNMYNMETLERKKNLYATALEFRLLRQHGYDISADAFDYFLDGMRNSREHNVEGILSLYEASFHSMEGETILDNARDFTTKFLKEYVSKNDGNHISVLINHALEFPLSWRVQRWEAQWFINVYERSHNMSPSLLRFAKLDFNMVQSIYLEDLKHSSRWWKRTGLAEKWSFARDRLVESFFWGSGMIFNPDFGYCRRAMTKVSYMIGKIDDVYDTYATLEELELFTQAVDRWDLSYAMDNLPDYMKIGFFALHNLVNDMAFESHKDNGVYIASHLKKTWTDLCKSYLVEAKWYYSGYRPSLEEYLQNASISIAVHIVLIPAYFLIPNAFRKDELPSLKDYPNIIRLLGLFGRLVNDLGTSKRETETGDIPKSIECYMNETGASEEEAREHIKSMVCITWKKINKEARDCSFSRDFIDTVLDLGRMALCFYQHGDGHTNQDPQIKSRILSLLIQPIPFPR